MNCSAALCRCIEEKLFTNSELIQGDPRNKAIFRCLRAVYVDFHRAYKINAQREKVRLLELELEEQLIEAALAQAEADRDSNQST
eukprot:9178514-Heterocapsa_arctica.AAC.1